MKTLNTLQEALNTCKGQLTAQNIINGRIYSKNGWEGFEINNELLKEVAEQVSNNLGGHQKTKDAVFNTILFRTPQHWGLDRMFIEERSGRLIFIYCAGQDGQLEKSQIRTYLKNL